MRCPTCLQGADHPNGARFTLESLVQLPLNAKIQIKQFG